MKINELRELTVEELNARTRELRKEALHMRIQQASGQLENTSRLKDLRKEVSRMQTLISERRLGLVRTGVKKSGADAKTPADEAPAKKAATKKAAVKKPATKKAAKKEAS